MNEQTTQEKYSSISISEEDLQNSLDDFLKRDENSSTSPWNLYTISGISIVLLSFAYIGHAIATEVIGLEPISMIYTLMKILPYFGGALLGIAVIEIIGSKRKKKQEKEKSETMKYRKTKDKLDDFLYNTNSKKRSSSTSRSTSSKFDSYALSQTKKLFRSRTDKKISGVCGGIAKYFGISSTVVRIIFVAAFFLGYGSFFLLYIAMALVMPKEPVRFLKDF